MILLFVTLGLVLVSVGSLTLGTPSNTRNWSPDNAILPYADINGNFISIHNIRNFLYRSTDDYTPRYYDKTFDLSKLKKIYYVVEPFSPVGGPAHTFLTYEFEGHSFVSISVEVRKQIGEQYSIVRSLFKPYEITYIVGDESDLIKLRSNYRKDKVFLYPLRAEPAAAQALFRDMIERVNQLRNHPEFYNLATNTCTTNIVSHVNKIVPGKVPFSLSVLLPSYSDKYAYDLGLIDTNLPFDQARAHFQINKHAEMYANDPNFSVRIREFDK